MSGEQRLEITIRPAVADDAQGIARTYMESAAHHARIDPERYSVPAVETILARYREGRQHAAEGGPGTTLIAEVDGEVVGFVDCGLDQSPDLMHKKIVYCHVAEIAVSERYQSQGVGGRLLQAAEDWGRSMGATYASLEFNAANQRAGLFYEERMGYRRASITAIKQL